MASRGVVVIILLSLQKHIYKSCILVTNCANEASIPIANIADIGTCIGSTTAGIDIDTCITRTRIFKMNEILFKLASFL